MTGVVCADVAWSRERVSGTALLLFISRGLFILATQVEEVLRARGEGHPVGLELDALGADGEVGEPLVAPEAGERGVVRLAPPCSVSLVAPADCEADARTWDEALAAAAAAAVRARFGAIAVSAEGDNVGHNG
jgi:hypothetical protein